MNQGVALLNRTQLEYKGQAKTAFPKTFDKMGKNEQEILTYAAYKAGVEALSKYKKAAHAAEIVYFKKTKPDFHELKSIGKELAFYYLKDGKEMVLDERASLIGNTFANPDFLALQIGKTDVLKQAVKKLAEQKIDFSHLELNLSNKNKTKDKVSNLLEKMRSNNVDAKHKSKIS
jgi:hypothetical protein